MWRRLVQKYDWLIYRMFHKSFNRFFASNIGVCYLLLYQTQAFIKQQDPNGEMESSSRQFWDAMEGLKRKDAK